MSNMEIYMQRNHYWETTFYQKMFQQKERKVVIRKFHFKTNGELLYLTGKAITKAYVPTKEENCAEQHFVCIQNCFGAWQAWSATWKSEPFFNSKVICPNMEYDSKATYQQTLPKALRTQAGMIFQYRVGSGQVLDKIPGSGSGSGRVWVLKYTIRYFQVSF